jgi:hypothetical protein
MYPLEQKVGSILVAPPSSMEYIQRSDYTFGMGFPSVVWMRQE